MFPETNERGTKTMAKVGYSVDFNFENSKWGRRPNNIRYFDNEADAIEFAKSVEDGVVNRWEEIIFD